MPFPTTLVRSVRSQRSIAASALFSTLLCGACVINADSHVEHTGKHVSAQTFEQIQPGKKQDFVLALLGEPTTRTALEGGTEIWKWEYRQKNVHRGTLLFVFSGDNSTVEEGATYVQFEAGLVSKAWQD